MGVCFKGYPHIAELLIKHGADLDMQHGNGGTALMFAAMFGRNDLIKILLGHGADKTLLDSRGLSVFDLAAQQGNEDGILILEEN
ncbi:ankyrin repeat domain-containing protein [Mucilaginibacter antarcticus]